MENEADTIILPRTEDLAFWLLFLVLVIVWLSCDLLKASKIRTPWILGDALMLSAIIGIIIQSLSFIDYSHVRVYSGSGYQTKEVVDILVKNQLLIYSGRLMMCVLIAYLLPGMARSGSIMDGCTLVALALSIISDVVSELWYIWKVEKRNDSLSALVASLFPISLIIAIICLLVLLFMAIRRGEKSRRIRSQKVPSALLCCDSPSYKDVKDHVLKCWLAARIYQPDYVLVRTGLCSKAFTVVTVCIGVHVIKQIYLQFTDNESLNSVTKIRLVHFVIFGQCVIVLIGWIVLLVRLATYADISLLRRYCTVILEQLSNIFAPRPPAAGRPTGVVSDFEYEFDRLVLPEDNARSLWNANRSGFMNVKNSMEQEEGKHSPSKLTTLLSTGTAEGEAAREKAEQLRPANGNSWMRTAVSLIRFMIASYDGGDDSVIKDAMQCYLEAWEYMNFVDGLKEEVKSLGLKANEEFNSLQQHWNERPQPGMLDREIKQPLEELRKRWKERILQKSWDSTEVTEYCVFKTGEVIGKFNTINGLQRVLASVYYSYMTQGLNKAVVQKCMELVKEGMEEEIVDVAILSAKAQGVLPEVGKGNNTGQASATSHIQLQIEEAGNNSRNANASVPPIRGGSIWDWYNSAKSAILGGNNSIGPIGDCAIGAVGNNSIRLRRPNDSLTDQTEIAVVGEGNDPENPVEPRDNTKVSEGKGQAELPPKDLIQSSYSYEDRVSEGKGQAKLPPKDLIQSSYSYEDRVSEGKGQAELPPKDLIQSSYSYEDTVGGIGDKSVGSVGDKSVGRVGHNSVGGLRNRNNNNKPITSINTAKKL